MDAYDQIDAATERVVQLLPRESAAAIRAVRGSAVGPLMLFAEQAMEHPGVHAYVHDYDEEGCPSLAIWWHNENARLARIVVSVDFGEWWIELADGDHKFAKFADAYKFALQQLGVIE
jgi:hypothetical protein